MHIRAKHKPRKLEPNIIGQHFIKITNNNNTQIEPIPSVTNNKIENEEKAKKNFSEYGKATENENDNENIRLWRHLQGTRECHAAKEAPNFGEVSPEGEGADVVAERDHWSGEVTCDTGQ